MTDKPTMNGPRPFDSSAETIVVPPMADDVLRKMNHADWLGQFSEILQMQPRERAAMPMSPFRAGAITRLKLAQRYVKLLEHDLKMAQRKIRKLEAEGASDGSAVEGR